MKFSIMLEQERKNRSMTQIELAERLYVSNKTISNWETERTLPDLDNLILLSRELNISLDKLLLEDPTMIDCSYTKKIVHFFSIRACIVAHKIR